MNTPITQLEFDRSDFVKAQSLANKLGYAENYAYSNTSDLIGLYCQGHNPEYNPSLAHKSGVIIKTKEFGFLFVQDEENINS